MSLKKGRPLGSLNEEIRKFAKYVKIADLQNMLSVIHKWGLIAVANKFIFFINQAKLATSIKTHIRLGFLILQNAPLKSFCKLHSTDLTDLQSLLLANQLTNFWKSTHLHSL